MGAACVVTQTPQRRLRCNVSAVVKGSVVARPRAAGRGRERGLIKPDNKEQSKVKSRSEQNTKRTSHTPFCLSHTSIASAIAHGPHFLSSATLLLNFSPLECISRSLLGVNATQQLNSISPRNIYTQTRTNTRVYAFTSALFITSLLLRLVPFERQLVPLSGLSVSCCYFFSLAFFLKPAEVSNCEARVLKKPPPPRPKTTKRRRHQLHAA
jgi:hypothetical protein